MLFSVVVQFDSAIAEAFQCKVCNVATGRVHTQPFALKVLFVFCVLCFVFCVLCFVFCVLCFVFCVLYLRFVFDYGVKQSES